MRALAENFHFLQLLGRKLSVMHMYWAYVFAISLGPKVKCCRLEGEFEIIYGLKVRQDRVEGNR